MTKTEHKGVDTGNRSRGGGMDKDSCGLLSESPFLLTLSLFYIFFARSLFYLYSFCESSDSVNLFLILRSKKNGLDISDIF